MSDPSSRRALRRHHRSRIVANTRKMTRGWANRYQAFLHPTESRDYSLADKQAVRIADNRKVCSLARHGCGNRRYGGYEDPRTVPEVRADQDLQEALFELFSKESLDLEEDQS